MSVIKRGSSKYWYVQFQLHGRTYIKSSKTTDKKTAELMEAQWRRQLIRQEVVGVKDRITVRQALDLYCDAKRGIANYRNIVRHVVVLNAEFRTGRWFDEVTSADLERFRLERQRAGYAAQTIKHTLGVLRGSWSYARKMGYQVSDLDFPSIKTPKGRLRYLTFDEEKRLLRSLDPRREVKGLAPYGQRPQQLRREMHDLYDFVVLLLDTGARYMEIASLEWNRINLKDRSISLWRPKVKNESILYMTDRVFDILTRRSLERTGPYVFTSKSGSHRGYTVTCLRKAFRKAGLADCSAHTLRHTHASRLIQNGLTLYEVQEILGHADIKTTMRYAHLERRSVSVKAREVIDRLNKENQKPELRVVK